MPSAHTVDFDWLNLSRVLSKYKRIKQIAVAKQEGGPLLDFVQLKVLYWNLYGLGMAQICRLYDMVHMWIF